MISHAIKLLCLTVMAAASVLDHAPGIFSNNLLEGIQFYGDNASLAIKKTPANAPLKFPPKEDSSRGEIYDFIVIGSGAAGSVIANRLSELPTWKILLLEAGYSEDNLAQYVSLTSNLKFTDYNWGFSPEPQPNFCLAMDQLRCRWPKGRVLGGSTTMSSLIYTRGNPRDYDQWAALGNPGWSYKDVLPYFLKSEDARLNASNPKYHRKGGYLSVESPYVGDYTRAFLQAGTELGYRIVDYNSPDQIGFSTTQANLRRGQRDSNAVAFLAPVQSRRNLQIITGARVTKILMEPTTKTAYGVEYYRADRGHVAKATKEVIASAGVINTPQLLMLSGIGPKRQLEKLGIKTLVNLPVGETLLDQIRYAGLVINTNISAGSSDVFDPTQLLAWQSSGGGPLATPQGAEGLAYINTGISIADKDYPDIELIFMPSGSLQADNGAVNRRGLGISNDYYRRMFAPLEGTSSITMSPLLLHPKSKGFLKLKSANPYDYPLLYANYLTDPDKTDARTLIAAIRFILRLIQTPAFQKYNATLNPRPVVGCEDLPFRSDEYWYCALQFLGVPDQHETSTCKMGPPGDAEAVVNHELKVYGTKHLRVADASILPVTISGHTAAAVIMVGEVASDLIKKEWGGLTHTKPLK